MLDYRLALFPCLVLLGAPISAQERYLHTDSIGSHVSETNHVFHCEENRISLAFVERFRGGDENLDLADRWRISLTGLVVSDREIQPSSMRELERRFHSFSWIERVTARCTRFNREVYLTVVGMNAEAWAAVGEGRARERPRPTSISFTINEDGSIRMN